MNNDNLSVTNTDIANEILGFLGGKRFIAMTGAKYLTATANNTLQFKIAGKNKGNKIRITQNDDETYTMIYFKITKTKSIILNQKENIFHEQLQDAFTEMTGLDTKHQLVTFTK